jgi:hypothetical protein
MSSANKQSVSFIRARERELLPGASQVLFCAERCVKRVLQQSTSLIEIQAGVSSE